MFDHFDGRPDLRGEVPSLFCCVSMPLDFEKSAGKVPPTQAELNNLLQFQPGDDWLSLVKKLRP